MNALFEAIFIITLIFSGILFFFWAVKMPREKTGSFIQIFFIFMGSFYFLTGMFGLVEHFIKYAGNACG